MADIERFSRVTHPDIDNRKKFDLQLGSAQNDEDRFAVVLQNKTVEMKTERFQWEATGNIFIEYESRDEPSGLAVTTADFWCHELARGDDTLCYLLIPTERLKQICRGKLKTPAHKSGAGDNAVQRGIVLSLRDLLIEIGALARRGFVGYDTDAHLIHHCCVCGKTAGNGYDVSLLQGKLGTWYCKEHDPP